MDINRNAPATAEGELQTAADPQTVFSVISAVDQWPYLHPPRGRPSQRDRLDGHDHGH
jgi:hypothetical protein